MTEKTQAKSIEVTYGRALALLFSLALVLFCAAPSWAQTAPSAAKSSAKPATATTAPAQHAKPNGGNHEGITVHGHWVITVKNPDGTVATRREFENGLNMGNGTGGTGLLASILGRAASVGSWGIQFVDTGGKINIWEINEPNSPQVAVCTSDASLSAQGWLTADPVINNALVNLGGSGAVVCSSNLSVTVPLSANLSTGALQLSGSAVVPQNYPAHDFIQYVATFNSPCQGSVASSACITASGGPGGPAAPPGLSGKPPSGTWDPLYASAEIFTWRALDGQGSDPAQVAISPGQTVIVTVIITFASAS
jgi:hypothetical protein